MSGPTLNPTVFAALGRLPLQRQERRVAEHLARNMSRIVTREAIVDELYRHRPDGGPLWAVGRVGWILAALRRHLAREGLILETIKGRGVRLSWRSDLVPSAIGAPAVGLSAREAE